MANESLNTKELQGILGLENVDLQSFHGILFRALEEFPVLKEDFISKQKKGRELLEGGSWIRYIGDEERHGEAEEREVLNYIYEIDPKTKNRTGPFSKSLSHEIHEGMKSLRVLVGIRSLLRGDREAPSIPDLTEQVIPYYMQKWNYHRDKRNNIKRSDLPRAIKQISRVLFPGFYPSSTDRNSTSTSKLFTDKLFENIDFTPQEIQKISLFLTSLSQFEQDIANAEEEIENLKEQLGNLKKIKDTSGQRELRSKIEEIYEAIPRVGGFQDFVSKMLEKFFIPETEQPED